MKLFEVITGDDPDPTLWEYVIILFLIVLKSLSNGENIFKKTVHISQSVSFAFQFQVFAIRDQNL